LLVIGLVNLFAGWLTLSVYSNHRSSFTILGSVAVQDFAFPFVLSLLTYSLTYASTAVLRNGVSGLGACMGIGIVSVLSKLAGNSAQTHPE
jgi:hypothetical protein